MRWATRTGCHVDRLACAWLIRRFIDPDASFAFVEDAEDVPVDAIPFDMRGAKLSHRQGVCTFETFLAEYRLDDPALADLAAIIHEADLADDRFDAPEAPGIDVLLRGLSLLHEDLQLVEFGIRIFDALYEYRRRSNLLISGLRTDTGDDE